MSDDDRDLLMAHDELVCPSCGNLREECSNPAVDWHPHTVVCYASASREWGLRRLQDKHKDVEVAPTALHPLDGVSVFVAQTPPEDDEFA